MPALISKLFAVPAMRDYSYRVLLDRDGRMASRYPGQEGQVQWLQLEQGVLVSQRAFTDAAALKAALENAPQCRACMRRGSKQSEPSALAATQPNTCHWESAHGNRYDLDHHRSLGHPAGDLGHLAHHRQ
jgi:hypothetical protein